MKKGHFVGLTHTYGARKMKNRKVMPVSETIKMIGSHSIAETTFDSEAVSYQRLKNTGHLPSPSDRAFKIYRLANDEKASIADIAAVVMSDPAISARIVKMANSALYRSLSPITSVDRAIVRLGLKMVRTISLGFSLISNNKKGPCREFDYEKFWSESLVSAVVARDIATIEYDNDESKSRIDPDEAFTVGLFCQLGRLALATVFPIEYAQVLRQVGPNNDEQLLKTEKETFGLDHNELAADMLTDWRLPDTYSKAIRFQKSPDYEKKLAPGSGEREIGDILDRQDWYLWMLNWTGTMSAIIMQPEIRLSKAVLDHAVDEAEQLGISPDVFPQEYDSIIEEWKEISSILEVKTQEVPAWGEIYSQANG